MLWLAIESNLKLFGSPWDHAGWLARLGWAGWLDWPAGLGGWVAGWAGQLLAGLAGLAGDIRSFLEPSGGIRRALNAPWQQ